MAIGEVNEWKSVSLRLKHKESLLGKLQMAMLYRELMRIDGIVNKFFIPHFSKMKAIREVTILNSE